MGRRDYILERKGRQRMGMNIRGGAKDRRELDMSGGEGTLRNIRREAAWR